MATEEEEIRKEVEQFYTNLYTSEEINMETAEELCAIASSALTTCVLEAQADLVKSITLKEVRATLKEAPKDKAPQARQPTRGSVQTPSNTTSA
ncbi:hypothetical protein DSO57_1027020 [Entomophthora muscae]|uniref:Uncharacterized protein n=1 Tax=Entomophthora muscae TaxID=34485 RepID=A0ACC2TZU3_9FUNG|nr:hypothetical protein DSO57_1027020 [Entomophthora muscae]